MLKKRPKTWATLILSGIDLNPDFVSRSLGLDPDFLLDSDIPNLSERPSQPFWQLNSSLSPDEETQDHIWDILKRIAPKRKEFKDLLGGLEAVIYISIEFADLATDGIRLEPRLLLLLGDLGIPVEVLPWLDEAQSETR
jgi:hypothetical protein